MSNERLGPTIKIIPIQVIQEQITGSCIRCSALITNDRGSWLGEEFSCGASRIELHNGGYYQKSVGWPSPTPEWCPHFEKAVKQARSSDGK